MNLRSRSCFVPGAYQHERPEPVFRSARACQQQSGSRSVSVLRAACEATVFRRGGPGRGGLAARRSTQHALGDTCEGIVVLQRPLCCFRLALRRILHSAVHWPAAYRQKLRQSINLRMQAWRNPTRSEVALDGLGVTGQHENHELGRSYVLLATRPGRAWSNGWASAQLESAAAGGRGPGLNLEELQHSEDASPSTERRSCLRPMLRDSGDAFCSMSCKRRNASASRLVRFRKGRGWQGHSIASLGICAWANALKFALWLRSNACLS